MPVRAKVIKGLECCIPMTLRSGLADCENCPYDRKITIDGGITECCHDLMTDALALLKAQEPIAPIQGADDQDEDIFCCGSCGAVVGETFLGPSGGGEVREKYCPECGMAVKWE